MMNRIIHTSALLALASILSTSVEAQQTVAVAFRQDAPPFAYRGDGEFSGFAVDLCERSIARMDVPSTVERVGVSASTRFDFVDNGDADVLCGPVTITSDRLRDYAFSIPFFISGISYATVSSAGGTLRDPTASIVGLLPNTTVYTETGEELFLEYFGAAGSSIYSQLSSLRTGTGSHSDLQNVRIVNSYSEGFTLLCNGEIQFLLGDVDILANVSSEYEADSEDRCSFIVVRRTITRELYGVLFSRSFVSTDFGAAFYSSFQSALFSLFQDGTAHDVFRENFPDQSMSDELANLFRLMRRNPAD